MSKEYSISSGELTPLTKELDATLLNSYYQKGKLGMLELTIPEVMTISVELGKLFEHVTNLRSFEDRITPDNIEAICIYGSVLYEHFATEKILTQVRKRWILFGPKQVKRQAVTYYKTPEDFDVLVILKRGLTDDKVIIPKRSTTIIHTGYGYIEDVRSDGSSGILTGIPVVNEYGYIENYVRGEDLDLHISYRSTRQFLAGLGQGDTLSESVVRYGVPLVGQKRFNEIIISKNGKRSPLHSAQIFENSQGVVQAKII